MCRIAAYFGSPLRLSTLLLDAPHSLKQQSRAAREMGDESVAGDGWGVGWFTDKADDEPGMLKSILPLWADLNAKTATFAIASHSIVGHIRLASVGSEVCFTNTPLYRQGESLFTVNGEVKPWPGSLSRALRAQLEDEDEAGIQGSTDAEMLGALWHTCLRRNPAGGSATALQTALGIAHELATEHGGSVHLSAIVADRSGFVAARHDDAQTPKTLYYLTGSKRWRDGLLVASEPLDDDPGWRPVESMTLVTANRHGLRQQPLRPSRSVA